MMSWTLFLATAGFALVAIEAARQRASANLAEAERDFTSKGEIAQHHREVLTCIERQWSLAFGEFNAIDIETTGLAKAKSRIIQIAIITFKEGRPVKSWHTYLNPGVHIPENAAKVNNITDSMVATAPSFAEIMMSVRIRLDARPLVAHNLKYDTEILLEEFARGKVNWKPRYGYCTMRMAFGQPKPDPPREQRTFYSKRQRRHVTYMVRDGIRWQKLSDAMQESGVRPWGPMHNALNDAAGCGELFVARATAAIGGACRALSEAEQDLLRARANLTQAHLHPRWLPKWLRRSFPSEPEKLSATGIGDKSHHA